MKIGLDQHDPGPRRWRTDEGESTVTRKVVRGLFWLALWAALVGSLIVFYVVGQEMQHQRQLHQAQQHSRNMHTD